MFAINGVTALTSGDPAGIGPDITLLTWLRRRDGLPPFCFIGSPGLLIERAVQLRLDVQVQEVPSIGAAAEAFASALPVLPLDLPGTVVTPGQPSEEHSASVLKSIETSVDLVLRGEADALVTNPISKHVLKRSGFPFPGHTEFLAHLAGERGQPVQRPVMLMASPQLHVIPATIHIPLKDVPAQLTAALIVDTAKIAIADFRRYFGVSTARVAICGLNPHAGEQGDMGREEIDTIAPAIETLRAEGHSVTGPHSADTLFHEEARGQYDVALAMYHDQALIPFKTLAFHDGVNVTLGLPFIRTSPDHGTAYNLAGTGRASPDSLIAALKLARAMAGRARAASHD